MSRFTLADRYQINVSERLPEFDTQTGVAYSVTDLLQPEAMLYALKVPRFPGPRVSILDNLHFIHRDHPHLKLVHLVIAANVTWAEDSAAKNLALVFVKPSGGRLVANLTQTFKPWTEEHVINHCLTPILETLKIFRQLNITHRAIRPDNIFFDEAIKHEGIVLGECCSLPPGFEQGAIFEPIEYAISMPIGRGQATIANDIYALGVLIAYLLNGGPPCVDLKDHQIIDYKLAHGSYALLQPKRTLSSSMHELLKALLADKPDQRWNLNQLGTWLASGRQGYVVPHPWRRATRPIAFAGRDDLFTPQALSFEMRRNTGAALDLVVKNELSVWLRNSLNDHVRINLLEDMSVRMANKSVVAEKLMAIIQILDQGSPVLWNGKSFMLSGVGWVLAESVDRNERLDTYQNLFKSTAMTYALGHDEQLAKDVQVVRDYLESPNYGSGIERTLYYLCKDAPCLSPAIRNYNALRGLDVLMALDHLGKAANKPEFPIDRHIAAFLCEREVLVPQRYFQDMAHRQMHTKMVAMMRLLADLQVSTKAPKLPGLCKWMVELGVPAIEAYKNSLTQTAIRKKLEGLAELGDLNAIIRVIDNKKALEADRIALYQAQAEVNYIEKRVRTLQNALASNQHYSGRIGENNAMMLAAIVALGFAFSYFFLKAIT